MRERSNPETASGQREAFRRLCLAVHCLLYVGLLSLLIGRAPAKDATIMLFWPKPRRIPGLRAAALSPDGVVVGVIGANGRLEALSREGKPLWRAETPEANALVLGNAKAGAIAYTRMDPDETNVYFVNAKGKILRKHHIGDPVWGASLDADGKCATVGSGSGRVFYYTISETWPSYHWWSLQGVPSTVSCSPDGRYIAAGTYDESGVETYRPSGSFLWRYVHQNPDLFFDAQISPSGKLVMAVLQPNPGDEMGRIFVWTASGERRLDLDLKAYRVRAMLSQNENTLATTFTRTLILNKKRVPEQKVSVFDLRGRRIWEKGGLFFSPTLVSIAPDGRWVLCHDGDKSLYLLGAQGKILAKTDLPTRIRSTYTSTDGRTILIVSDTDQIQLLRING